jgi:hypothetical protein
MPAVLVEAYCADCVVPVSSAVSDSGGGYRVYLPDPGNRMVDAGSD